MEAYLTGLTVLDAEITAQVPPQARARAGAVVGRMLQAGYTAKQANLAISALYVSRNQRALVKLWGMLDRERWGAISTALFDKTMLLFSEVLEEDQLPELRAQLGFVNPAEITLREFEAALRLLVPTDNNTKNGLGFPMAVAQGLWSALTSATIASRWTASCGSRQSSLESTRVMAPPRRPGCCWRGWQRCGRRVRGAADERGRWRGAGSAAGSYGAGGEARALGCGAGPLLSLTPGGSAAAPAGYWGETGSRPAPRCRAQSPPGRRGSPSSPRE